MRLEARHDLRGRIQDRFADVRFVGDDRLTVLRACTVLPKSPVEHRAAALRVGAVAGVAGQFAVKSSSPRGDQRLPAAPPPLSHVWYSPGSITTTSPIMPECWVPQYSAQKRW